MGDPSWVHKLLYLGGKRAPHEHRPWITDVLDTVETRKLGVLLALPNALIVCCVALVALLLGDGLLAALLVGTALLVLVSGAGLPGVTRRRADRIALRNGV
jgi:Flp pilus assembly protein TadB